MADPVDHIPAEAGPAWDWSAAEIARTWGVTVRRVNQLAEEGRLRRCGRGRFDVAHANLVKFGAVVLGQDGARGMDGDTLAAVGWLGNFMGRKPVPVTAEELDHWRGLCARWRLTGMDASALIARAAAILGERCPPFETSAR